VSSDHHVLVPKPRVAVPAESIVLLVRLEGWPTRHE
jgi:hypothetical protein